MEKEFWKVCAILTVAISAVVFQRGHYTRNSLFTLWICFVTMSQLVALWGLMAGVPEWVREGWKAVNYVSLGLLALAVVEGLARYEAITNRPVVRCLVVMAALQLVVAHVPGLPGKAAVWAHNLSFFGPALWMFLELSGARWDRLPIQIAAFVRFAQDGAAGWARAMVGL